MVYAESKESILHRRGIKEDKEMMNIKEIVVKGKEVLVRYNSEVWKTYMKKEDIPPMVKGVQPIPRTVINFMINHPNKVR